MEEPLVPSWETLLNETLFERFVSYECTPDTPVIFTYYNYLAFVVINDLQRIQNRHHSHSLIVYSKKVR
jgi:hypothetical protein